MGAFDKIAAPVVSAAKKASVKVAAEVTPTIKKNVDLFVKNKAQIKALEADQITLESTIIEHVRPQQDSLAYSGNFTKSLVVEGITSSVNFVTVDKFSVPQDEDVLKELHKLLGAKYDNFFQTKRTIALKEAVVKNEVMLNKIAAVCEKAGMPISDLFDVGDKVVAADALDEKQYALDQAKLEVFRSLVRQNKPSLR